MESGTNTDTIAFLYLSPSGSTRKTGREICSFLAAKGYVPQELDLALYRGREKEVFREINESSVLVVGCPVYACQVPFPLAPLLKSIPLGKGKPALAFCTYGGVDSGSALYQLWKSLNTKGYRVLGAAEVLSVHSMMFRDNNPVGLGHPNEEDFEVLRCWVDEVAPKLELDGNAGVNGPSLRPGKLERLIDWALLNPRVLCYVWPTIRFMPEKCDHCGACQKKCPLGRLDDLPRIDKKTRCLYCYQCVRYCREGALHAPMWTIHPAIRLLSKITGIRGEHTTKFYI